jgi:hypothetical protein
MRMASALCACWIFAVLTSVGFAQSPPAAKGGKRAECLQKLASQQLQGPEKLDFLQLCTAEGRVDCIKQAIAQKIRGSARAAFVKSCVGGEPTEKDAQ